LFFDFFVSLATEDTEGTEVKYISHKGTQSGTKVEDRRWCFK